jgi:hypothetical protein
MGTTITGIVYLDMPQQFLIPQLDEEEGRIHFQQDGEPPHYLGEVREYSTRFPVRWISSATLWQFKTLYMSSEYIYISFQSCKTFFETPCIMDNSCFPRVLHLRNYCITIMDISHRPVFYLKHNVSETGFCLRL